MRTALSIAGSDCSGGAGIQADLKTMIMHGVYGMSVITALTAQNTTGVMEIEAVSPRFLACQLDAVFTDIFPDAVKIGMVPSAELMEIIVERLRHYGAKHLVIDPVMVSTTGSSLMEDPALEVLMEQLLPLAQLVTPNLPEAEVLSGFHIQNRDDMIRAASFISEQWGCAVLLKGGHGSAGSEPGPGSKTSGNHKTEDVPASCDDLLFEADVATWMPGRRIPNPNTHGTGCTLSSAIASNLAKGRSLREAVSLAKEYISGAITDGMNLGKGRGPLNHAFNLNILNRKEKL